MNIVVTNLSKRVSDDDLRWLFQQYGRVNSVSIWVNYEDEALRFAIVQMPHRDAKLAITQLDGKCFSGRRLWVEKASSAFGVLRTLCAEASRKGNMLRPLGCDLPKLH
jgi:RNA recognition motif-containing protein